MVTYLIRGAVIPLAAALLTACSHADAVIQLKHTADSRTERLQGSRAVTVAHFADARGDEGDNDPLRVGGVYNGYGIRIQRIVTPIPWSEVLTKEIVAGLDKRGVSAIEMPGRPYAPGTPVSTPFVLGGEIRNFSAEGRWLGMMAHVSGIARLWDQQGQLLVETRITARVRPSGEAVPASQLHQLYEKILSEAMQQFVRQVVTDPGLTQRLAAAR